MPDGLIGHRLISSKAQHLQNDVMLRCNPRYVCTFMSLQAAGKNERGTNAPWEAAGGKSPVSDGEPPHVLTRGSKDVIGRVATALMEASAGT